MGLTYSAPHAKKVVDYKAKYQERAVEEEGDYNETKGVAMPKGISRCPMPEFVPSSDVYEGRGVIGKEYASKISESRIRPSGLSMSGGKSLV